MKMKMKRKKRMFFVLLLGLCSVVSMIYSWMHGMEKTKFESIPEVRKDAGIAFCKSMVRAAEEDDVETFLENVADPGEKGLVDCYYFLQEMDIAPDAQWDVRKIQGDDIYCVYFSTRGGGRAVMMMKNIQNDWIFIYAAPV